MKLFVKKHIQKILRSRGMELVKYSTKHREKLLDLPSLSYRELVISDAMLLHAGEISLEEARFLSELVKSVQSNGPIVEIGTLFGKSTFVLLLGSRKTSS